MNVTYIHFDVLDSTNTWTKAHAKSLRNNAFTCVTAGEQTAGIGRFKRPWISPQGNLFATFFFTIPLETSYLPNIGQILAYSCATLLQKKGLPALIKWPNDLLIEKKKVAGILTETVNLSDVLGVVVGIGLNLELTQDALSRINQPATSLAEMTGKKWDIDELLTSLIEAFLQNLTILQTNGFSLFRDKFNKLLAFMEEEITLNSEGQTFCGLCQGVEKDGRLKLLLPSGEERLFWSGLE